MRPVYTYTGSAPRCNHRSGVRGIGREVVVGGRGQPGLGLLGAARMRFPVSMEHRDRCPVASVDGGSLFGTRAGFGGRGGVVREVVRDGGGVFFGGEAVRNRRMAATAGPSAPQGARGGLSVLW